MPQPFNSYTFNSAPGFTPLDFYKNATGINFNTGERDQNAFDYVTRMAGVREGDLLPLPYYSGTTQSDLDKVPEFGTPGASTGVEDYKKYTSDLTKDLFKYDTLSKALNIGAGTLASAALLPFAERLRQKDFELGLKADMLSPTKQAQRNLALQQQFSASTDPTVALMDAFSRTRAAARAGARA